MNRKTYVLVMMVVFVLITIGSIIYWGVQKKNELLKKLSSAEQQIQNLQQANDAGRKEAQEVKPTDQELFNAAYEIENKEQWKQYRSKIMKLTFQYPSTLVVDETKDKLVIIDPSQPSNTAGSWIITITKEIGTAHNLSAKYIGFDMNVQWNPYQGSSMKFASNVAMIPHFSADSSRYATYLFPNGFIDVNRIPPTESSLWTSEKIQNQVGILIVANTISDIESDDLLKKVQEATNMDLYQDLPARILSTLRFIK